MFRDIHHGRLCPYCQRPMDRRDARLMATRDHVVPRIHGGREIIVCCFTCNNTKGDMLPDVWRAYMAANPGWWLLSRAERRARAGKCKSERRLNERPIKCGGRRIPIVVPPELIWT